MKTTFFAIFTAYVAICFFFLLLFFSRLNRTLLKDVVLAYFNQGAAQLFFLGLYKKEHKFFHWVLCGGSNQVLFLGHCGNVFIVKLQIGLYTRSEPKMVLFVPLSFA